MKAIWHENPFFQASELWEFSCIVHQDELPLLDVALDIWALSTTTFETSEDSPHWRFAMLLSGDDRNAVMQQWLALRSQLQVAETQFALVHVEQKDWVSLVQASFKPIHAGRFYVHGSHITDAPPAGSTPILMDAGAAFGTGEHQTTTGCLRAISELANTQSFSRPLDMGCGSGILAIAAAKCLPVKVLGVDIDETSVNVANANFERNGVADLVHAVAGDGYHVEQVTGKYDLIMANILAAPLVEMAADLKRHLADGGTVILAGLLDWQAADVLAAHAALGLHLTSRIDIDAWPTLVLK